MGSFDYDIGVIGGGAAGLTVASGAAQLGARTLLVEKEPALGGDCLHFGCVPSKTLIRSAHVYHDMKNAAVYGLPQVDLPPVDFRRVADRVRAVVDRIQVHDSVERFCGLGVKVCFGEARFKDEHAIDLDGRSLSARSWVIATGSSPIVPPIDGLDQTAYLTNREIFYMDRLPASMIVLGGGPIGIEMAQAFARFGTAVTVIDMAPQILGKEDRDMADAVMDVLQAEGVAFFLNSAVVSVREAGRRKIVGIKDTEGQIQELEAEALLVAIGRTANVDGLGLDGIGVEYTRDGINVDARMRTSRKHIYAAGDINGGYQFTHAAGYEGGIVVSNAVFRLPRKADYTHLPWCTYTDPELASIGMNEKTARLAGIDYTVWSEPFGSNDRSLAEGQPRGQVKMLLDAKEKPLGVQILGPHAGELLNEWVAIFNGRVKLSTLAAAVHPYPTIGEINKRVAGNFFAPKIFSEKIKKGLKLFFNLKGRACEVEQAKCLQDCSMEE
ncbi:MAG: FAD-dependent oxidoreductase [Desulfobacterales bacterium]|nr:FAD-dependent oxidoreductase [Desulfobacterales bacterium]MDJ0875396.1 FAD-dependent oxidoreductase [Desulfobacterales bacterium]MDJ0882983.1 FAD-dependent oxidoreductase [Desulfobacterales bacterium]